jgi:hypothetical protein
MMRQILAIAGAAACLCFGIQSGQAQTYGDAPWCAQIELGTGGQQFLCYYHSVEECAPHVLAGNRGTCSVNPYYGTPPSYTGYYGPAVHPAHRTRHPHWH